jgi:hypothetical protein
MRHQHVIGKSSRLGWTTGVVRMTLSDPADALDRVLVRARHLAGGDTPHSYDTELSWELWLHRQLGLEWPCPASTEFEPVWTEAVNLVRGHGLELGRGAYGGWDDADPGLARAAWCLTAHLQPQTVVETGVARGMTSRIILERLERNGTGQLWSIDLPAPDANLQTDRSRRAGEPSRPLALPLWIEPAAHAPASCRAWGDRVVRPRQQPHTP